VPRHRLRSFGFLAILAVAGVVDAPEIGSRLSIIELTAGQQDIVGWAVELFDAAELELPGVTLIRYHSSEPCFGRRAAHLIEDGRSVIRVCNKDTGPEAEHVILHELAHAWDRHSLSEDRREAFLRVRGLRVWRSKDTVWEERGAEHAAEVVVWGLIDRQFSAQIPDNSCAELLAGYTTLTGRQPLHGFTGKC
jgi:hypothetical protein